jgi:hypothetical protein
MILNLTSETGTFVSLLPNGGVKNGFIFYSSSKHTN